MLTQSHLGRGISTKEFPPADWPMGIFLIDDWCENFRISICNPEKQHLAMRASADARHYCWSECEPSSTGSSLQPPCWLHVLPQNSITKVQKGAFYSLQGLAMESRPVALSPSLSPWRYRNGMSECLLLVVKFPRFLLKRSNKVFINFP